MEANDVKAIGKEKEKSREEEILSILKKYGVEMNTVGRGLQVDGLKIVKSYLEKTLPFFSKGGFKEYKSDDMQYCSIWVKFAPYGRSYYDSYGEVGSNKFELRFLYNDAPVRCSGKAEDLLEAIELAARHDDLGINLTGSVNGVFFKDSDGYVIKKNRKSYDSEYHERTYFILFKKGTTAEDIIKTATGLESAAPEN